MDRLRTEATKFEVSISKSSISNSYENKKPYLEFTFVNMGVCSGM